MGLAGVAVFTGGCGKKESAGKPGVVASQGASSAFQGYTLISQLM